MRKPLWLAMILVVMVSGNVAEAHAYHRKIHPETAYLNDMLKGTKFDIMTSAVGRMQYLRKTPVTSIPHDHATNNTVLRAMSRAAHYATKAAWKDVRHVALANDPTISSIYLESISSAASAPLTVVVNVKHSIRSASIAKAYAGWSTDFTTNFGRFLFENERRLLGFQVNPPKLRSESAVYATGEVQFPNNVTFLDSIIVSKSEVPPYFVTFTNENNGIPGSAPFMFTGQGPTWTAAKESLDKAIGTKWR